MIEHSYVGCDLSKAHVDFFDAVSGRHERIANTPEAIAAHLVGHKGSAVRFVFEATGAYGGALREQLAQAGLAGCQVNPMRARRFARSLGRLAKTDRMMRQRSPRWASGWPCLPRPRSTRRSRP